MAEQLTRQQQQAVEDRGGKLLVSAAAGSGKTKVLVDRLLLHLTEGKGKINIDDFLIITYTKAAASELRGKIAAKLNERLAEDPGNKFLQHQLQRLYLTKISTVHAFCSDILREYAYRLDIPGDFRVAEEQECQLLELQVLDKLLERAYEDADSDFLMFIDSQELGRDDRSIPQIILQVYNASRCHIDPGQWLQKCVQDSTVAGLRDAAETVWGKYLIDDLHQYLDLQIDAMGKCADLANSYATMTKPAQLLYDTVNQMKALRSMHKWDEIVAFGEISFGRLTFPKNVEDLALQDRIKTIRAECKKGIEKKLVPFADKSDRVLKDLEDCAGATKGLIALVNKFSAEYNAVKHSRRILDFSDLEHKTLDLLLGTKRQGITSLAVEIGERFHEIMVDEYQDSNAVQDSIFAALTHKKQNCFMVGDVKQSIYQFRLADPGIFLEKYNSYVPADHAEPGQGRKVMLSSNFRSAGPVIHAVNDVFSYCMSPEIGGLTYGEDEALSEGIGHETIPEPEIELCAICVQEDTYEEEAFFTADRIVKLLDGTHRIREKDGFRAITAEDIVILLRSPGSVGAEFQHALEKRGIRVNSGTGVDLLQTEEVGFIRSMLQIIDNPLQDIPLIAALSSRILCFNADELTAIRAAGSRKKPYYESLKASKMEKAQNFIATLRQLRGEAKLCSLSQLIERIVSVTRMDSIFASFPDGKIKTANLQAFYQLVSQCESANQKELSQFLDYLNSLEEKGLTVPADQNISDAVTIMSIHKSKGLEFPVVFLCGLSRDFNREDARAQVLCNKELGIGLNCVDIANRVRYPSIAKKAIAAKIVSDSLSEEMRVLYVAMTRAKDRLIMTYAEKNLASDLEKLVNRMDICDRRILTSGAQCPGTWVLMTALRRMEAGALFEISGRPDELIVSEHPWRITVESVADADADGEYVEHIESNISSDVDVDRMSKSLNYLYPYMAATVLPSKHTATQLKGRQKDQEASENTQQPTPIFRSWRTPSFAAGSHVSGTAFGNAVHSIMQHISFRKCTDLQGVSQEIRRLVNSGVVDEKTAEEITPEMLWAFFSTELGTKLRLSDNVLREFKFSVLEDAGEYAEGLTDDKILLQGVVDCAIIDDDGITVLDFKTDRVTNGTIDAVAEGYKLQVQTYARVLSRIFKKNIVSCQLYFFRANRFITVPL